jgi:hypothetical protein
VITPSEIRFKCQRIWQSDSFWESLAQGQSEPVIEIPFGKLKAKELLTDFAVTSASVTALRNESKEVRGYGYTIGYTETSHRQLGAQKLPTRIYFETLDDFTRFAGKKKELEDYRRLAKETISYRPELQKWVERNPHRLIENKGSWNKIMAVCTYFLNHPSPGLYLRQLDIPNVDTKFIENNKSILRDLLDEVLPDSAINRDVTGFSAHGFERRYYLLYEEQSIRFRILDKKLAFLGVATDISLPAAQFNALNFPCKKVFFTENKTNSLCFPDVADSIVVFGGGYGISALKEASWLRDKEIFYWGDIDTHGFSILSQLRGYFPHVHSIMMDIQTLRAFKTQWVEEEEEKRCRTELSNLTCDEWQVYSDLRDNIHGDRVRLEQEKISFSYLCLTLQGTLERE